MSAKGSCILALLSMKWDWKMVLNGLLNWRNDVLWSFTPKPHLRQALSQFKKKTLQRLKSFIWNPSLLNVRLEVLFPIFMLNCDSLGDYCCSSFILFLCQHVEKECLWELLNFTQRKFFHVPRKKTIIHLKGYKAFFISSIFSPIF